MHADHLIPSRQLLFPPAGSFGALQIVLFSAGVVGESGKDEICLGIVLKEVSDHFQTAMTIERGIYPIKFEPDIFS